MPPAPFFFLKIALSIQGLLCLHTNFNGGLAGKESTCIVGDLGLIPGLGRFPREGKGFPLQYSGLENSVNCIVHGVTKSPTRLSNSHSHFLWKMPLVIWYELHWICRLPWVVQSFSQYWLFQSRNMVYLFLCLCHLWFLSLASYNFWSTGLLPPYAGLFLDIFKKTFLETW